MTIKNSQTRREKFLDPHLGFLVPEEPLWCLGPFAPRLSLFSFTELVDNPRKDCHARTRPKGSPSQSNNSDPKPHGSPTLNGWKPINANISFVYLSLLGTRCSVTIIKIPDERRMQSTNKYYPIEPGKNLDVNLDVATAIDYYGYGWVSSYSPLLRKQHKSFWPLCGDSALALTTGPLTIADFGALYDLRCIVRG
ncbi:hypothetical protein KQX54_021730 [Cotesia glomerata]|uniref:Uncharacterized protein n=1 Tax=Cotesia glomerata TaxID=32391 RepID=A0AAV7J911_COTGL|nr:hypothetical protein KQX54_021730 [Cotesia glomerata]